MYRTIARNIVQYFGYGNTDVFLLVDEVYVEIAKSMKQILKGVEIRVFQTDVPVRIQQVLNLPGGATVLLLAEPVNYVKYRLFQYLDFSNGEPQISGTTSRVLIFPVESICRMFFCDMNENTIQKESLLNSLKENRKYSITTALGTDLRFEARRWIPLDFEVCTAPVEDTIHGKIVVDGAVFFRKNDFEKQEKIVLEIEAGKVTRITACDEKSDELLQEYLKMTSEAMADARNIQLAEIGIGFFRAATISDCFMEAEAAINTCHFCFGNNVCYGGKNASEFHGNSVLIRNPKFVEIS